MNLRNFIDGGGKARLNLFDEKAEVNWKPNDTAVIRRRTSRTGPKTSEVMVGKILAVGETTATVVIQKPGGATERKEVNLNELSPVTASFKRSSIQFNPQFRRQA